MSNDNGVFPRIALSVLAAAAIVVHFFFREWPDPTTAGLIVLGILPWIAPFIKSVELPGIGKIELKVEEVKKEVAALRFLISAIVSTWEFVHLQKLANDGEYQYEKGSDHDDRFINEIIRLKDFGLVRPIINSSLYGIPLNGNLKNYVELTELGREYLKLRKELRG